jgi:hypothetical protein
MTRYDVSMRRTIYLPDELDAQVEEYLRGHPEKSFSALVQEALEERVAPRDIGALLELAGIVKSAPVNARDRAEDQTILEER